MQEGKKERADMVMMTGGNQEQSQEENQEATLVRQGGEKKLW